NQENNGQDFVGDLRSGFTDGQLMEKYRLTTRGLGSVFRSLVEAKTISFSELVRRFPDRADLPEMIAEFRDSTRYCVDFTLPIHESGRPEAVGIVCDISDEGIGTRGLRVQVDEIKTLVIPVDRFFRTGPVMFQGMCCWVDDEDPDSPCTAGFRIIDVLRGNLGELKKIIKRLGGERWEFRLHLV
ncbi:hypothetical protein ACFL2Q_13495, partial [Thermodesulfobacteriota bacterium]